MFTSILQVFLILDTLVVVTLGCSCAGTNTLRGYCTHEIAVIVEVMEPIALPNWKAFKVRILRLYKGDLSNLITDRRGLVILRMGRSCSFDFMRPGEKYIIFGNYGGQALQTNLCSGSEKVKPETFRKLNQIKNLIQCLPKPYHYWNNRHSQPN